MKTIIEQLQWRYATKQFDASRTISDEHMHILTESLRLSPSSFGLQPWHFIVITDSTIRAELQKVSWNQAQITKASCIVVHCARKHITPEYVEEFVQSIRDTRFTETTPEEAKQGVENYKAMMIGTLQSRTPAEIAEWCKRQVYISQGVLLATAAQLEIDSCPMEGFSAQDYDRILGLENSDFTTTLVTPLGYRSAQDVYAQLPKVRFSAEKMITKR